VYLDGLSENLSILSVLAGQEKNKYYLFSQPYPVTACHINSMNKLELYFNFILTLWSYNDSGFTDLKCSSADNGRLLGMTPCVLLWMTVMKGRKRL